MSTLPTGEFGCLICGAPYGHGNMPCPMAEPGRYQPQPFVPWTDQGVGAKLDRIIELLEALARAQGHNWQGGPR